MISSVTDCSTLVRILLWIFLSHCTETLANYESNALHDCIASLRIHLQVQLPFHSLMLQGQGKGTCEGKDSLHYSTLMKAVTGEW